MKVLGNTWKALEKAQPAQLPAEKFLANLS